MTKAISLSAELAEVRCAVEGARFIADALATHALNSRGRLRVAGARYRAQGRA